MYVWRVYITVVIYQHALVQVQLSIVQKVTIDIPLRNSRIFFNLYVIIAICVKRGTFKKVCHLNLLNFAVFNILPKYLIWQLDLNYFLKCINIIIILLYSVMPTETFRSCKSCQVPNVSDTIKINVL